MTGLEKNNKGELELDVDYELFVQLIFANGRYGNLDKIDFSKINSFYGVNQLYFDNRAPIKNYNAPPKKKK